MASYRYDNCGTGWARDFPEFGMSTQVGDIALQRVVQLIASQIRLDKVQREDLDKQVLLGLVYVATIPAPEVLDQAVLSRLANLLNATPELRGRGWTVSWKDWRS